MKQWWPDRLKQIEERKDEARKTARKMLREVLNRGDEEGFIACARLIKPGLTDDELKRLLKLFRDLVVHERR